MILQKIGYSYNDLTIVPAEMSDISSRSECDPFYSDGMLPLFTAPMSAVVNVNNLQIWKENKINPILPRTIDLETRLAYLINAYWVSMSLDEFRTYFIDGGIDLYDIDEKIIRLDRNSLWCGETPSYYVCIDIANGHMSSLYKMINEAKSIACQKNYKLVIMTGNIANPDTYSDLYSSGVDYIRLSIGSGNGCLTSSNTGVHYPIASLIDKCHYIRTHGNYDWIDKHYPKIVADGGIRNYSDIIKALALGADYVMVGSLFSGFLESAADIFFDNGSSTPNYVSAKKKIEEALGKYNYIYGTFCETEKRAFMALYRNWLYKKFYGMSTKKAQEEIIKASNGDKSNFKVKTSEGVEKMVPCKYTVAQWTENFISYLKSAMSYTNAKTLDSFKLGTTLIINSPTEINAVNK